MQYCIAGREVLNSYYMQKAYEAGLDYAIVNTEKLIHMSDISDKEKELSERAKAQNVELEKLKANIEEKLAAAPEERKTKFFKDTFDGLVKDYSVYLSQIEQKIAENSRLVSNFEKIKAIR